MQHIRIRLTDVRTQVIELQLQTSKCLCGAASTRISQLIVVPSVHLPTVWGPKLQVWVGIYRLYHNSGLTQSFVLHRCVLAKLDLQEHFDDFVTLPFNLHRTSAAGTTGC